MTILERTTFETSRESEYFSEKELRAQIGHGPEYWPIAILRELVDNSLDSCEMAGVAPQIDVLVADDRITVSDNGPGIPTETLKKSMNYMMRVSDKAYYVSPTRGQMGNALKVVWAAPFVACGQSLTEVVTKGEKHTISVTMDRIAGKPKIEHTTEPFVRNGNSVSIEWQNSSTLLLNPDPDSYNLPPTAHELIESFHAFNPHAKFSLNAAMFERTDSTWKKWQPNMPTSAHWYHVDTLRDLVAGYITSERNNGNRSKTVREFVSEFRGLSSTAKQKEVTAEWSGAHLHDFVSDGDVDRDFLAALLVKMQGACIAPKPAMLGLIGKDHITAWMKGHGVSESSIKYVCKKGIDAGLPYVLETAFGIHIDDTWRRIITGLNWSPVLSGDPDATHRQQVQTARLDPHDPVTLMVHIVRPRFEFMDRGKTRVSL